MNYNIKKNNKYKRVGSRRPANDAFVIDTRHAHRS
jgi:hypothetical protein